MVPMGRTDIDLVPLTKGDPRSDGEAIVTLDQVGGVVLAWDFNLPLIPSFVRRGTGRLSSRRIAWPQRKSLA